MSDLSGERATKHACSYVIQACQWALHLCKRAGVKFILHPVRGCFDGFIESGCVLNQRILGVSTKDGAEHRADKVIVACECGVAA